jgi:hypothetical protein
MKPFEVFKEITENNFSLLLNFQILLEFELKIFKIIQI